MTGVTRPPLPKVAHLAMAQKQPWDLRSMGMGAFHDLDEAKDACAVMSAKDADFTSFEVKTCPIQMGLTEEDDEYLDKLSQRAIEIEMEALEEEVVEDEKEVVEEEVVEEEVVEEEVVEEE